MPNRIIAAAKKAGVPKVEVKLLPEGNVVIFHLNAPEEPIADDSNNSFDKIMRKPGAGR